MRTLIASIFIVLSTATVQAEPLTERIANLQIAMQSYIDSNLVDKAILDMNFETGTIDQFYPVETHPMVIEIGDSYVLCSDLARADGSTVPIDLYIAQSGDNFTVYTSVINNRAPLKELVEAGIATRIR